MALHILFALGLGIALAFVWFGCNLLLSILSQKTGMRWIGRCSSALAALIPTAVILLVSGDYQLNVRSLLDWQNWLAALATALAAAWIVSFNKKEVLPAGRELLLYALDGVMMEIPQRMMMQTFVVLLLRTWGVNAWIAVPITAVVWCVGICVQTLLSKERFGARVYRELLASFVFSLGAGAVLLHSQCILFPMAAHALERVVSTGMRKLRASSAE